MTKSFILFAASILMLASCGQRGNKAAAQAAVATPAPAEEVSFPAEGSKFKDFIIPDSDGKEVKFSDFVGNGKYVLVDFWASWCGPCRREIPNIKDVYEKYKGDKFNVLGVAVWDDPQASKEAMDLLEINWDVILNAQQLPTDLYGIEGIPQIMLFGPDGTILKKDLRGPAVEAAVKEALGL